MRCELVSISVFFLFIAISAFAQEKKGVAVHTDPRLSVLVKKNQIISKQNQHSLNSNKSTDNTGKPKINNNIFSKGFRVQIYSGTDRHKAQKIRDEFDRNYPGVQTYLSYTSPYYRVKVGNFKTKKEAMGTFKEASSSYFPCMIVPDKIIFK